MNESSKYSAASAGTFVYTSGPSNSWVEEPDLLNAEHLHTYCTARPGAAMIVDVLASKPQPSARCR